MGDIWLPLRSSKTAVKVGAVQAEPRWLDLQASVDKTIALIEQAGKEMSMCSNILKFGSPGIRGCVFFLPSPDL
jgi:hypothetical protein